MSRRYGSQVEGAPKTKLGEFESKNKVTFWVFPEGLKAISFVVAAGVGG